MKEHCTMTFVDTKLGLVISFVTLMSLQAEFDPLNRFNMRND